MEPTEEEMSQMADGDEVKAVPLDPQQKKLVEAMRIARIIEEGEVADS